MNFTKLNQMIERNNATKKPIVKKTTVMRVGGREYKFKNQFYTIGKEPEKDYRKHDAEPDEESEQEYSESESENERMEDEEEEQDSSDSDEE